ncbi:flagella synthesis protein FlgN [Aestuariibacter salexigens]|uniref:flagella synthesis protein FlgN n=1 Tax=Aestuariibacter salexigens TaxID=226010 RepID=UPI000429CF7C|nr:flagellar export chaperone FlgN [Aestuariibacter salexigens]
MKELVQAAKTQTEHLSDLKELLETELHLISGRDAEALLTLVKNKEVLLDKIRETDEKINQLFSSSPDKPIDPEAEQYISEARDLLEQCKFRTEINTTAIEQGQLKLEHLRNTLIELRAKESLTYDKSGKPRPGSPGKGVSA